MRYGSPRIGPKGIFQGPCQCSTGKRGEETSYCNWRRFPFGTSAPSLAGHYYWILLGDCKRTRGPSMTRFVCTCGALISWQAQCFETSLLGWHVHAPNPKSPCPSLQNLNGSPQAPPLTPSPLVPTTKTYCKW